MTELKELTEHLDYLLNKINKCEGDRLEIIETERLITEVRKPKRNKKYFWLKERLVAQGQITSWHLNNDIWDFADKFFQSESSQLNKKIRRSLTYYMRQLVADGYAYKSEKSGTGYLGKTDYGVNCQTIWKCKND